MEVLRGRGNLRRDTNNFLNNPYLTPFQAGTATGRRGETLLKLTAGAVAAVCANSTDAF